MSRLGIMGGTFNPPHNAHLLIAELAREQYALDRVIFIAGGNPPHKNSEVEAIHRLNMTRLAIEGNEHFTDDDFEVKRDAKSYTVHTLEYLKDKYPSDELFFIIGEDSLADFSKWYMPEKIAELSALLVFPRKSKTTLLGTLKETRKKYGENIFPIDAPVTEISSTEIRQRIRDTKTVRYMLPDKVIRYIEENDLYV